MKKWLAPVVSLAVFLVLLAIVLWVPEPVETPVDEPETEMMLDIPLEQIARFTVNVDPGTLSFEPGDLEGQTWILIQPATIPLDQLKVRSMINYVTQLVSFRMVEEYPANLADFGLEQPWGDVVVELRDGATHVLKLGDPSPLVEDQEPRRYAKLEGRPEVILVSSHLVEILQWSVKDIRRKEVLGLQEDDRVVEIFIEAHGAETRIVHVDPEPERFPVQWKIVSPYEAPSGDRKARDLISALRFLDAESFIEDWPEDLRAYGLDDPSIRITLTVQNKDGDSLREETLLVGSTAHTREQEVYVKAQDEPFIYTVKMEKIDNLTLEASSLSRLRPYEEVNSQNLTAVAWNQPGEEKLSRLNREANLENSEWSLTGRRKVEFSGFHRIQSVLDALTSLEAVALLPLSGDENLDQYGFHPSGLSLKVTMSDRPVGLRVNEDLEMLSLTLRVGGTVDDRPGHLYARVGEYDSLYVIPETEIAAIREAIESMWQIN